MELTSLHPVTVDDVREYLDRSAYRASFGDQESTRLATARELNNLTAGLARDLIRKSPVFAAEGLSFTAWEARVDRGVGMLLRPPSRLFGEAGLPKGYARRMDIRLDPMGVTMAGAFIPPHLVSEARQVLEDHLDRSVRRMVEAGMDAVTLQSLMIESVRYASEIGSGLIEASGVLDPFDSSTWPQGATIVVRSSDRDLIRRIEAATKPPKRDGIVQKSLKKLGIAH